MTSRQPPAPADDESSTGQQVKATIAVNLKKTRLARGFSLRELSERTGISPAMLSQLERGQANATLDVLTRLADALDLSFADLTWRYLAEPQVVRSHEGEEYLSEGGRVRTIFGSTDRRRFEISLGEIVPDGLSERSAHGVGSLEYTVVVEGSCIVETTQWKVQLAAGDAVKFSSEIPHAYRAGSSGVRILTLVSSTDDWPEIDVVTPEWA